jgi:hypothetical protein
MGTVFLYEESRAPLKELYLSEWLRVCPKDKVDCFPVGHDDIFSPMPEESIYL